MEYSANTTRAIPINGYGSTRRSPISSPIKSRSPVIVVDKKPLYAGATFTCPNPDAKKRGWRYASQTIWAKTQDEIREAAKRKFHGKADITDEIQFERLPFEAQSKVDAWIVDKNELEKDQLYDWQLVMIKEKTKGGGIFGGGRAAIDVIIKRTISDEVRIRADQHPRRLSGGSRGLRPVHSADDLLAGGAGFRRQSFDRPVGGRRGSPGRHAIPLEDLFGAPRNHVAGGRPNMPRGPGGPMPNAGGMGRGGQIMTSDDDFTEDDDTGDYFPSPSRPVNGPRPNGGGHMGPMNGMPGMMPQQPMNGRPPMNNGPMPNGNMGMPPMNGMGGNVHGGAQRPPMGGMHHGAAPPPPPPPPQNLPMNSHGPPRGVPHGVPPPQAPFPPNADGGHVNGHIPPNNMRPPMNGQPGMQMPPNMNGAMHGHGHHGPPPPPPPPPPPMNHGHNMGPPPPPPPPMGMHPPHGHHQQHSKPPKQGKPVVHQIIPEPLYSDSDSDVLTSNSSEDFTTHTSRTTSSFGEEVPRSHKKHKSHSTRYSVGGGSDRVYRQHRRRRSSERRQTRRDSDAEYVIVEKTGRPMLGRAATSPVRGAMKGVVLQPAMPPRRESRAEVEREMDIVYERKRRDDMRRFEAERDRREEQIDRMNQQVRAEELREGERKLAQAMRERDEKKHVAQLDEINRRLTSLAYEERDDRLGGFARGPGARYGNAGGAAGGLRDELHRGPLSPRDDLFRDEPRRAAYPRDDIFRDAPRRDPVADELHRGSFGRDDRPYMRERGGEYFPRDREYGRAGERNIYR